ncbi:hypothetical protein B0H13DRAFT_2334488 [Mycena leptocephala]|nr:hypothetical protein B0H13DRAFT_2334488 [Mycena leptocephala]
MIEISCPPHSSPSLALALSLSLLSRYRASARNAPRLFDCSSVVPLDLRVEVIRMRIAQLCASLPLTLRRYDRLVRPRSHLPPPETQGGFFLRSSLPPAFLPQVAGPEERARPHRRRHLRARWGDEDAPGSATGPFSAVSKPPRALRDAVRSSRVCGMSSASLLFSPCTNTDDLTAQRPHLDLATNCCGYRVLRRALDCEEEVCLLIVSELPRGDPATTLVNKHASHMWSQHAFENLEESAKDGIVDELLEQGAAVFSEIPILIIIDTVLEHGSEKYRQVALEQPLTGLLEFATNELGSKSVVKALKEGGKETLDRAVQRMCEPAKVLVLIASVLSNADNDQ